MRGVLVQLRKDAGLNQAALAARLRITQSQVSKYERGERVLGETRLRAWLSALGKPIAALDPSPPNPGHAAAHAGSGRAQGTCAEIETRVLLRQQDPEQQVGDQAGAAARHERHEDQSPQP